MVELCPKAINCSTFPGTARVQTKCLSSFFKVLKKVDSEGDECNKQYFIVPMQNTGD